MEDKRLKKIEKEIKDLKRQISELKKQNITSTKVGPVMNYGNNPF